MKKVLISLVIGSFLFTLTACGKDEKKELSNKGNETSQQENVVDNDNKEKDIIENQKKEENNKPIGNEKVIVDEVINCKECVFAYFIGENEKAKKIGDTLSSKEYTTDITTLKTSGGKQRHNFFGLVLKKNKITRAYACILKDNKIYCIEGSTNGAYHSSNIGVLNQIFTSGKCRTISDGNTYTCTDGSYNGDTKTNGYASLHYETSCTIYGGNNGNAGRLICH